VPAFISFYDAISNYKPDADNELTLLKQVVDLPSQWALKLRLQSIESLATGTLLAPSDAAFNVFLGELTAGGNGTAVTVPDFRGTQVLSSQVTYLDEQTVQAQVSRLITFHSLISTIPARDFPAPGASEDHVSLLPT